MLKVNIINTERLLSPTQIGLADFVINPYRGCELGCTYCYAQLNKNIKKRKGAWGRFLDVKINAPETLEKELNKIRPKKIIMGSTTECFQPQEKKFHITENLLRILKKRIIPIVVLTKSSLIEDYVNLLNYHNENKVYFTFIFKKNIVKNIFEQNSPTINRRIETIKKLIKNNIKVKIHIGPFIPYIESLQDLFQHIPRKIEEVEIEIYNFKMGNFAQILKIINQRLSSDLGCKIENIYATSKNYYDYCSSLQAKAREINEKYNFKLNFIIPEFNYWYTDKIKYE